MMNNPGGTIQVLYFAALAERLHCNHEQIQLPPEVDSAEALKRWLVGRGAPWQALADEQVRCAVNQEIVKLNHRIGPGDEVAFFPPVTGG